MKKNLNALTVMAVLFCFGPRQASAQALNFGAYSYVTIGNILSSNQSYTKEAWVRVYPNSAIQGRNILSAYDHPFWLESNHLSAANSYGTNPTATVTDPDTFQENTWTHVAVTYDAASTTMKLYKNGILIATNTSAPGYYPSVMQIGAQNYGDFIASADVDEARVWGVALSQAQILANMNCDVQGHSNLLAYYKFDEGVAGGNNTNLAYATDYSGNSNNGTFANFNLTGSSGNYVAGRTINAVAAITGGTTGCAGSSISLSDATSGGTWSSSNTALATVGSTGTVSGVSGGAPVISYTASNGCIALKSLTINTKPSVSTTVTNVSCYGNGNGSISTSVSGAGGYSYSWSNGATTSGISSLTAGTYSVTVTDANTCTASASVSVTQPAPTSGSITITPANTTFTNGTLNDIFLGYGPQSATLTSTGSGTYSWSPSTYLSNTNTANPVFAPSAAGHYTYSCTVTNGSGCASVATVSFCVVDAQDHSHSGKVLVCHNGSNSLSISSNAVNAHLVNHGDYLGVCGGGCSFRTANVNEQTIIEEDGMSVTAFPNPFSDGVNIKIHTEYADPVHITIYDLAGRIVDSKHNLDADSEISVGDGLAKGMYLMLVSQGNVVKMAKIVKN